MSIEHSRKHGAFDSRYPPIRHEPPPASLWHFGAERLDWQGFLAGFYPSSRRHDLDVLAAYQSYVNDVEAPAPGAPAANETARWESEGGAITGRLRPPGSGERRVAARRV